MIELQNRNNLKKDSTFTSEDWNSAGTEVLTDEVRQDAPGTRAAAGISKKPTRGIGVYLSPSTQQYLSTQQYNEYTLREYSLEGCLIVSHLEDAFDTLSVSADTGFSTLRLEQKESLGRSNRPPIKTLSDVDNAIEASRHLIELEDDWDGEGSPGYSKQTWRRAAKFVRQYARHCEVNHGSQIPVPDILPGPDGSIDVHWEKDSFELLINIPVDPNERAEFYGDDYGKIYIKGNLDPDKINYGLIEWLQRKS